MTGSAARGAASSGMPVAPDLAQRLAKSNAFRCRFTPRGLPRAEKNLVEKLVDASRHLEDIYWRQSDPEDSPSTNRWQAARMRGTSNYGHYLWINGSRFDQIEQNRPFVGPRAHAPGPWVFTRRVELAKRSSSTCGTILKREWNLQFHHHRALARRST